MYLWELPLLLNHFSNYPVWHFLPRWLRSCLPYSSPSVKCVSFPTSELRILSFSLEDILFLLSQIIAVLPVSAAAGVSFLFSIEASFYCPIEASTGYLNELAVVPSKFIRVWTASLYQGFFLAKKRKRERAAFGTGAALVYLAQEPVGTLAHPK